MSQHPESPRMATVDPAAQDNYIYNRLLKERIIWLGSEVRDENANAICSQLLLLSAEDPGRVSCAVSEQPSVREQIVSETG